MASGSGGNGIRGSRVGSGRPGESEASYRGETAPRVKVTYHCGNGHLTALAFAADVELPQTWDCPRCGAPAGPDDRQAPQAARSEPYKSHLAYVQERRSDAEGEALLEEALARIAGRRPAT